jgi:ATP-binding cassette subfamily B protein
MKYKLNKDHSSGEQKNALRAAYQRLLPLMQGEGKNLSIAFISIVFSSAGTLLSPIIISHAIDTYILGKDWNGVLLSGGLLLLVGVVGLVAGYIQTITMGGVGRRVLFNLRAALFEKLQELPVAFFNQNKAGDLISRINNDTDKLNQFFAQALIQFIANFFLI